MAKRTVSMTQPEGQKGLVLADLCRFIFEDCEGLDPAAKITVRINFGSTIKSIEVGDG